MCRNKEGKTTMEMERMSKKIQELCNEEIDRWNDILCELKNNEPIVGIDYFPVELKIHVDKENLHGQIAMKYYDLKNAIKSLIDLLAEQMETKYAPTCPKCGAEMFLKTYKSPMGFKRFHYCQACGEKK